VGEPDIPRDKVSPKNKMPNILFIGNLCVSIDKAYLNVLVVISKLLGQFILGVRQLLRMNITWSVRDRPFNLQEGDCFVQNFFSGQHES
jgi:hypothetical protein